MNKNNTKRLGLLIFVAVLLGLAMGVETVLDNVHTVTAGAVYRSAQPSAPELEKLIAQLTLRSILNLRGADTDSRWYQDEVRIAEKFGVVHYDIDLSAGVYVSPDQLNKIVALIHMAPKPILIHCHGGADRTGLVSAVWKLAGEGVSLDTAARQLSIAFGHFPYLLWRNSAAMDVSLFDFAQTLEQSVMDNAVENRS